MSALPPLPSAHFEEPPLKDADRRRLLVRAGRYAAAVATLSACGGGGGDAGSPGTPPPPPPPGPPASITSFAIGLQQPWSLAFLPDGTALVTEKPGRLRRVGTDGGLSEPITGVPSVYYGTGTQGGLLDVVIDPNFASNRRVYVSYAEPSQGGAFTGIGTAVARAVLSEDFRSLSQIAVIYRQTPRFNGDGHFGARLAFRPVDNTLFVTLGDRQTDGNFPQTTDNHLGKVVRINIDGGNPGNNFSGLIWSVGHRNPQGAAIHPDTGELWISEHGPLGGDEINRVVQGGNYGWPQVSYGCNYNQTPSEACRIGGGTHAPGFREPAWYWVPISCAPAGMCFYTGDRFPEWRGNLFVGTMADQRCLRRLTLNGNTVTSEEQLFRSRNVRMRDVKQGPDGWLYVLDETNGHILRVER